MNRFFLNPRHASRAVSTSVRVQVEAGADVNKADSQGAAALSFAAEAAFAPTVTLKGGHAGFNF